MCPNFQACLKPAHIFQNRNIKVHLRMSVYKIDSAHCGVVYLKGLQIKRNASCRLFPWRRKTKLLLKSESYWEEKSSWQLVLGFVGFVRRQFVNSRLGAQDDWKCPLELSAWAAKWHNSSLLRRPLRTSSQPSLWSI